MDDYQKSVIRCAFADLCGAIEAYHAGDIHVHDWRAHQQSIEELIDAFPSLELQLPNSLFDDGDRDEQATR